jgi:EAL domain-containing protein (putative c-di-GMP-specific phosphodiesterase class I)/ActR/RegA family two-component response regulator
MSDQVRVGDFVASTAGIVKSKPSTTFCLIVDDEKAVRSIIARALRKQMVMTEECGDASSALAALKRRVPDLIFLDVSLERSDAIEVIRGLGDLKFRGGVQLMSGRDLTLLEEIKRVGERYSLKMLPVLQKPFRVETIANILHDAGISRDAAGGSRVSLFEALCSGGVDLCYQPKINLRSMSLAGAEGHARVVHPRHGALMPSDYLPGADEASLLSLAEQALMAALRDWSMFSDAGALLRLAINVPMSALAKVPIASLVRENRPKSSNWPGLILDISEDQILRDIALAHEVATQLRIYNIHLAIDRFGAGYSSLEHLQELPFAELKLDRRFVAGCADNDVGSRFCQAAIQLTHRLGCKAVAVGIDRRQDLQVLTQMGCDLGQGALLGPPITKEKLAGMIRQRTIQQQSI